MALQRTRKSLFYLVGYLSVGGIGFLMAPALTLNLFLSNGSYSDVMVRFVGVLLLGLAILVGQMVRHRAEALYSGTLIVRAIILCALGWFYFASRDPLMIVLLVIVGIGFGSTLISYGLDRRDESRGAAETRAS